MGFGSLSSQQRIMVLLELMGGPKFAGEMKAASAQTTAFGKSVQLASRRTFFANQALYTMRRYAFYGTTAVVGLTAVVAKLGYSYLSAMQNARVALSPVIKDHVILEGYLKRLFSISKYSPFVLKDLAVGFRQLFAGLNPIGISAPTILTTIQSLTDFMSYTGKTGPGQFQRVALAIQHMAFAGRLTGYLVNQLSRDGIPIFAILNKEMGITGDQLHNISKMGIPAAKVLDAINKYARESPAVSGAAMRLSLHTFSGLMQVARDSISQLAGAFIGSSYKGTQSWLFQLLKRGGPLDQLSNMGTAHGGQAAIMLLSKQLTGNTGLGRGFMLLVSIVQNLGRVIARVLVPAFIIGAHSLILLYPILKLVNLALGFMADNAWWLKYVFAVLAAEFILVHSRALLFYSAMKLANIATFGAVGPLIKYVKFLKVLRTTELSLGALSLGKYALAQKGVTNAIAGTYKMTYINDGMLARFIRRIYKGIAAFKAYRFAAISAGFATAVGAGLVTGGAALVGYLGYREIVAHDHPTVGMSGYRNNRIVQAPSGQRYIQTAGGGRLTRAASVQPGTSVTSGDTVIHSHLHLDGKQVAESVTKVQNDKRARR